MIRVAELWIYPVKSCRGISLQRAEVTHQGLQGDRQWMIVDAEGKFITQRTHPQLAKVQTQLTPDRLTLTFEDLPPLEISTQQTGALKTVNIWRDRLPAIDQSDQR